MHTTSSLPHNPPHQGLQRPVAPQPPGLALLERAGPRRVARGLRRLQQVLLGLVHEDARQVLQQHVAPRLQLEARVVLELREHVLRVADDVGLERLVAPAPRERQREALAQEAGLARVLGLG